MKYRKGIILLLFIWFVAWGIVGWFGFALEYGPTVSEAHLAKHLRHAAFACVLLPLGVAVLYFFTRWIRHGFRS